MVPHEKDMIVSTGFHAIPRINDQVVQLNEWSDTKEGAKHYDTNFQSMYKMTGSSVIINLQEASDSEGFATHRQVQLDGVRNCKIAFSKTGKYFAIYLMREKIVKVFDAMDVYKLFDMIHADRPTLKVDLNKTNP